MTTLMTVKRSWLVLPCLAILAAGCKDDPAEKAAEAAKAAQVVQAEQAKVDEAQLASRWNTLSAEIPEIVEVVNARVDLLEKKHEFPKGVDAKEFKDVKQAATTMTESWQQALGAFANSNMPEAVAAAQVAKDKGSEVMQTLQMAPSS